MIFKKIFFITICFIAVSCAGGKTPPQTASVEKRESADEFERTYQKYNVTSRQRKLIEKGRDLLGTPYIYGGTDPNRGMDCSAVTQHMYKEALGVNIPRTTKLQNKIGKRVSRSELIPGDLVFMNLSGHLSHVGVYIGDGKFFHASSSRKRLMVANLFGPYYSQRYHSAVRVSF